MIRRLPMLALVAACSGPARPVTDHETRLVQPPPPGELVCPTAAGFVDDIGKRRQADDIAGVVAQARAFDRACNTQESRWLLAESLLYAWRPSEARGVYERFAANAKSVAERRAVTSALARLHIEVPGPKYLDAAARTELRELKAKAEAQQMTGDFAKAAELYEAAFRAGGDPRTLALAGRAHQKAGNDLLAKRWYARAINLAEDAASAVVAPRITTKYVNSIGALAYSPDGTQLAIGSADTVVRVWDLERDEEILSAGAFVDEVSSVAYSHDGTLVAAGSRDGTAQVFDVTTGKEVAVMKWPAPISAVAFAPGDRSLATAGVGAAIRLWNLENGQRERVLPGRSGEITSLAFAPAQRACACKVAPTIAAPSSETFDRNAVDRSEVELGKRVASCEAASVDAGAMLVAGTVLGTLEIWTREPTTLKWSMQSITVDAGAVRALDFDSRGMRLAVAGDTGPTKVFGTCDGKWTAQPITPRTYPAHAVAWSRDDRVVIDTTTTRNPRRPTKFEVQFTALAIQRVTGSNDTATSVVRALAAHPRRTSVAAGDEDGNLRTINENGKATPISDPSLVANDLAVTADGSTLIACGNTNAVTRWNLKTGERATLATFKERVLHCRLSASGKYVAVVAGKVARVIAMSGDRTFPDFVHACAVRSVAQSPDDHVMVTGCADGSVHVWQIPEHAELAKGRAAPKHAGAVLDIVFVQQGTAFATASADKTVRLWNAKTFAPVGDALTGFKGETSTLASSRDGRWLAVGGSDAAIRVFDLSAPAAPSLRLFGHLQTKRSQGAPLAIRSLAFAPDGKRLVSSGWDQTLRGWNLVAKVPASTVISRFETPAGAIGFGADGKVLYAQRRDGQIAMYRLARGEAAHVGTLLETGRDWVVTSADGRVDASPDGAQYVTWLAGDTRFDHFVGWQARAKPQLAAQLFEQAIAP